MYAQLILSWLFIIVLMALGLEQLTLEIQNIPEYPRRSQQCSKLHLWDLTLVNIRFDQQKVFSTSYL